MDALASRRTADTPNDSQEKQKMIVTWKEFEKTALILALKIYRSGWQPDYIVSIGRGGNILGDVFSRVFKKRLGVIMAESYKKETQGQLLIAEHVSIVKEPDDKKELTGKVLLVDDLADTGKTFVGVQRVLHEKYADLEIRTAGVYHKTLSKFVPTYTGRTVQTGTWIVFPYERFDDISLDHLSREELLQLSEEGLDQLAESMLLKG